MPNDIIHRKYHQSTNRAKYDNIKAGEIKYFNNETLEIKT